MLIIGIAGGSGSGKTTVVREIERGLPKDAVSIISLDSYYKDNGHLSDEEKKKINFDHPSSFEFKLLNKHLDDLIAGKSIEMPIYSYVTCARAKETITVEPKKIIIVEGIMALANPTLRKKLDIKVFVDADSDDRLMRIIGRDVVERGRNYNEVLNHYALWVKVMHETFIEPTKKYADIIIPQGGQNKVGIDILLSKIKLMLAEK
ncbi:MAG: uridine kinase [Bacteroidales bacterium]|nr:uridine kinase [Bacteroidales bacterium]